MIAKKYEPPKVQMPARDGPGQFEFKEGTGHITSMVSYGTFLEMYKVDATLQLRSPEDIDPERTNPNAPWVSTVDLKAGSGNEIVSRLCIQSSELLKSIRVPEGVDKEAVLRHMHKIKEELLQCQHIALRVNAQVQGIIGQIQRNELQRDNFGRGFNPFPQVENLQHEANNFLIGANKIVRAICAIPRIYVQLKEDANFDFLAKTLATVVPSDSGLLKFISDQSGAVRRIVDLRNFSEHAKDGRQTEIVNFRVQPNGQIMVPVWGLVKGEQLDIHAEMAGITQYLQDIAEGMFILSLEHFRPQEFPMLLARLDKPDPNCALYFQYVPDMSKIKFIPPTT